MTTEATINLRGLPQPANILVVGTPRYHLLDGKRRIGPKIVPSDSVAECSPVYGFSDKKAFDRFCHNSPLALTPYPIVMTYLRNALGAAGDALALMVIDAPGPTETDLQAATLEAVLHAHENRATSVAASFRLIFDPAVDAYHVEQVDG